MPFADARGRVTEAFQVVGDRMFGGVEPLVALWKENMLFHAHTLRVTTGQ